MHIRSLLAAPARLALQFADLLWKPVALVLNPLDKSLVKIAFDGGRINGMTFNVTPEQISSDVVEVVMIEGRFLYRRTGGERDGAPVYALAA